MNRRLARFLLFAFCCAPPALSFAGLVIPDDPIPVTDDYDLGYQDGFIDGTAYGRELCRQDPASCSIFLSNVLPPAPYGETEPNDTLISADPLTEKVNFWGQSYSSADNDWYYVVTPEPNYNLTLNFTLPDARTTGCRTVLDAAGNISFDCSCQQVTDPATGENALLCSLTGWTISIRNAIGMVIAEFDTGFSSVEHAETGINYRTTLGLAGTYYIQIKPNAQRFSYQQYNLTVALEPSPLESENFLGGYTDAEIEPNNVPGQATSIGRGVSMFGMINLRFDSALCDAEACTYAQDEPDWFTYRSTGREILQLAFCDRTACPSGDWFVQVFNSMTATAIDNGEISVDDATPLMAFNTNTTGDGQTTTPPTVWQLGLPYEDNYYIRVGLKRTLEAPCIEWTIDRNNDGIPDGSRGSCGCTSGEPACEIDILNPGEPVSGDLSQLLWPVCPNGTGGGEGDEGAFCETSCVCVNETCSLYQTDPDGDGLPGPNPAPCRCLPTGTTLSCTVNTPNPGEPTVVEIPDTLIFPLCPDGSGGGDSPQCTVGCMCTDTTGKVEIPEDIVSAQYNLTLTSSLFGSLPMQ